MAALGLGSIGPVETAGDDRQGIALDGRTALGSSKAVLISVPDVIARTDKEGVKTQVDVEKLLTLISDVQDATLRSHAVAILSSADSGLVARLLKDHTVAATKADHISDLVTIAFLQAEKKDASPQLGIFLSVPVAALGKIPENLEPASPESRPWLQLQAKVYEGFANSSKSSETIVLATQTLSGVRSGVSHEEKVLAARVLASSEDPRAVKALAGALSHSDAGLSGEVLTLLGHPARQDVAREVIQNLKPTEASSALLNWLGRSADPSLLAYVALQFRQEKQISEESVALGKIMLASGSGDMLVKVAVGLREDYAFAPSEQAQALRLAYDEKIAELSKADGSSRAAAIAALTDAVRNSHQGGISGETSLILPLASALANQVAIRPGALGSGDYFVDQELKKTALLAIRDTPQWKFVLNEISASGGTETLISSLQECYGWERGNGARAKPTSLENQMEELAVLSSVVRSNAAHFSREDSISQIHRVLNISERVLATHSGMLTSRAVATQAEEIVGTALDIGFGRQKLNESAASAAFNLMVDALRVSENLPASREVFGKVISALGDFNTLISDQAKKVLIDVLSSAHGEDRNDLVARLAESATPRLVRPNSLVFGIQAHAAEVLVEKVRASELDAGSMLSRICSTTEAGLKGNLHSETGGLWTGRSEAMLLGKLADVVEISAEQLNIAKRLYKYLSNYLGEDLAPLSKFIEEGKAQNPSLWRKLIG